MQSKTTRGVRRLLVSTGVISLVLSVAAPSALAAGPSSNGPGIQPGADGERVEICHNGRIIEPNENSLVTGHSDDHDGASACCPAGDMPFPGGGATGGQFPGDGATEGEFPGQGNKGTGCETPDEGDVVDDPILVDEPLDEDDDGATLVEICRDGELLEVAADAVDAHLAEGAVRADNGICPEEVILDDDESLDGVAPVIVEEPVVIEDPKDEPVVEIPAEEPEIVDEPVVEVQPDTAEQAPVVPAPVAPKPVTIISSDSVTKPTPAVAPAVPASPAVAPAVTPNRAPEVLGSVTTRTPSVAGTMVTRTGVTTLAATGTSTTTVLAIFGSVLLLVGLGLQLVARRQTVGSALGA